MKKIFYEKKGRRYAPVAEYDSDWVDSFPKGSHLVMCYPGGQSRKFNIDPAYAPLIAAGRIAENAMQNAMMEASKLKPSSIPLNKKQRNAWDRLAKAFGQEMYTLHGPAVHDVIAAGIETLIVEANKILSNPAAKKAHEQFLLICELTKEQHDHIDS